ncbi:LisH domain-containing protein [Pseudozyma hubeiensis]|nr:LisH domain-containing protein [Pseudozyma hubeiensis]
MDLPSQLQGGNNASPSTAEAPTMRWDGDQMLHIYVCDYLRKRGFDQAAQALRHEAGLDPQRKVPIDAPQSLLFEWWVIFWEVYASRWHQRDTAAPGSISADAQTYAVFRPSGLSNVASNGQPPQLGVHRAEPVLTTAQARGQGSTLTKAHAPPFAWQASSGPSDKSNSLLDAPLLLQEGSSSRSSGPDVKNFQRPQQQQQQQHQQRRTSVSNLPQLDLEASQQLGLPRLASRVLIQQCMDMMNLGGKEIDQLTAAEKHALAKRVARLQTAQNDAQVRLAQLHGLQPPKPLVPSSLAALQTQGQSLVARLHQEAASSVSPTSHQAQAGQKRKDSPVADADGSRQVTGPGPGHVNQQLQSQQAHSMRRLSHPGVVTAQGLGSPLTPSSGPSGGLSFSQAFPHPTMQHSPASSAPTPSAHPPNPQMRRPSVLGYESAALQAPSPHRPMYASGLASASPLPISSVSPLREWHADAQQEVAPLLQQGAQRPAVMMGGMNQQPSPSASQAQVQHALLYASRHQQPGVSHTFSGPPSETANARPPNTDMAMSKDTAGPQTYQLSIPPPNGISVLGATSSGATAAWDDVRATSQPLTPFADLEYDFNVMLSNSTRLNR